MLKVVGGAPELGGWDCGRAPAMAWGSGDAWELTLELPEGRHEFKVARGSPRGCLLLGLGRWREPLGAGKQPDLSRP